jgi:hypothetical protein
MNVLGYFGVFMGLKIRNDALMVHRLDMGRFDTSETVTIRIPLTLPYSVDEDDYERVNGKFEYNGEAYRLLSHRLAKDTLTIICVKDTEARKINRALTAYVKTFADQPSTNTAGKPVITLIKEYLPETFGLESLSIFWERDIRQVTSNKNFVASYTPEIVHPPERL